MILQVFVLAVPIAIAWVILTAQVNLAGLGLGYIIGLFIARLGLSQINRKFDPKRLPQQFGGLLVYIGFLLYDIWRSGIDVLVRVLGLRPVRPGIIRVAVQDSSEVIAALSAHGITITPGQLVVDFDETEKMMYVHCLDVDSCVDVLDADQTRRLKYLRRFLS